MFYKQVTEVLHRELLIDNLDVMLAKTLDGPLYFERKLATAPSWIDSRYLRHIVIGMNARLALLRQIPEWTQGGENGQHVHTLVQLGGEVESALTAGEEVEWMGCPAVPEKVLEGIQKWIATMETAWTPPPPTEIMTAIAQITGVADELADMAG